MGTSLTIHQLIAEIGQGGLILPEFQRGYVWTQTQVREFLSSLYHGYPTGSFLIWKTPNPGAVRGPATDNDGQTFQLILDGQQRLTSIYALATGQAPPFYEGEKLYFDIYFNVQTEEFSYFKPTIMKSKVEWLPVTRFLQVGLGDYLKTGGPVSASDQQFLFQFFDRLQQLDGIGKYSYYLDTLGERNMDEVVKIFNYVNSRGTRLSKSDLALSHICALWPEARQVMRATMQDLSERGFSFGLDFFVRLTACVATGSGFYEPLYRASVDEIKAAWAKAKYALEYLLNVLRHDAYIDSNDNLPTSTIFVPLVVYLAQRDGKFANNQEKRRFLHWMFAALMWARYSASSETKLNQDLEALNSPDPPAQLRENIVAETGRIHLEGRDLASKTSRSPFYSMAFVVARAAGAVDWFNELPLYSDLIGKSYGLEAHHIFPQSTLYKKGGFNSNLTRDRDRVNELANIAFLTKQANLKITNRDPHKYLADIDEDVLAQQRVPLLPALWQLERYEDFQIERRHGLATAINHFMEALLAEGHKPQFTIADYIATGESATVEFKSSLRWDFKQKQLNKSLEKVIAKTVAAFMNSQGGTLIIGVSDHGDTLGLDADFSTLSQRPDQDGWQQTLTNALNLYLTKEVAALVDVSFAEHAGKVVAIVRANKARKAVYLTDNMTAEFYVRSGNTTQQLDVKQANGYIQQHFSPMA